MIIQHWFPLDHVLNSFSNNGIIGVSIFFVLSGYLITNILLYEKELIDANEISITQALKNFWIRRVLRIVPLYYLTLLILFIFNIGGIRDIILWPVLYLYNFYQTTTDETHTFLHFWTLSVEQQFYLIWPLLIFYIPKKKLLFLIILTICIGPLFRYIAYPMMNLGCNLVTFSSLDCLGFGALLSYCRTYNISYKKNSYLFSSLGILTFYSLNTLNYEIINPTVAQFFSIAVFSWILVDFLSSQSSYKPRFLKNRILIYVGQISYGIYIFHNFVLSFIMNAFNIPNQESINLIKSVGLSFVCVIVVSACSWHFFEKPFLKLKRYFPVK